MMNEWCLGGQLAKPEHILSQVKQRFSSSDVALLQKALELWPEEIDLDDVRFQRSLTIATILNELNADGIAMAVALHLALTMEGENKTEMVLRAISPEERRLLKAFLDLNTLEHHGGKQNKSEQQRMEYLRRVFLVMAQDIRVVLLRLADRLFSLRKLEQLPSDGRPKLCEETIQLYAPLANRLGIWQLKSELEDLSFSVLQPETYRQIANNLSSKQTERQNYIEKIRIQLLEKLVSEGITAEIRGRPKHIYSIWSKMRRKDVDLDRIYDVYAVRVLVDSVAQCYMTLGIVHQLWTPISGEFDDYIAQPKPNGYRSIHTAVIGPDGQNLEVQIRTHQMDREAELGVAAHWRYKERDAGTAIKQAASLRQLLELSQCIDPNCQERTDDAQTDTSGLFAGRVLVLTPQNDIVDLPAGATPIDFAYHVHSQIGHRCRGARVNDKLAGLKTQLRTGDKVEIITGPKPGPSRDWLEENSGFTQLADTRSKIRSWFRKLDRAQNIAGGRELVERELRRLRTRPSLTSIAEALKFDNLEDFFEAVGYGFVSLSRIAPAVERLTAAAEEQPVESEGIESKRQPVREAQGRDQLRDLLTQTAQCCNPLPGDLIKGFITRGRGLMIHKADCPNLVAQNDEKRIMDISWDHVHSQAFPARLCITAMPRPGILRDVAGSLTEMNVTISSVKAHTNERKGVAVVVAVIEVENLDKLTSVIEKLRRVMGVQRIERG